MLSLAHAALALSGTHRPLPRTRACSSIAATASQLPRPPSRCAAAPLLTPDDAAAKRRQRKARWRKGAKQRAEAALTELVEQLAPPFGASSLEDAYAPELTEALRRHGVDWEAVPAAAHPRRAAMAAEGLAGAGQVTKRGLFKRLQVQSFAAALRALPLPEGSTVLVLPRSRTPTQQIRLELLLTPSGP